MSEEAKQKSGSVIGFCCYEKPEDVAPEDQKHRRIGALVYYRSHECQLRLDLIPSAAWAAGIEWFIANFIPSEKVPEPPFIDGDLFATTEVRGDPVFCGHVHTRQKDSGETQYYARLIGIPVREWIRIRDADKEKKSIYLKVRL